MFEVHKLNMTGMRKAQELALLFDQFLRNVEKLCQVERGELWVIPPESGREIACVLTKLQEASFFAKRAMAMLPENQERE